MKAEWTIDGAAITIDYGRPSLKGRPGTQLMPPGKPWRQWGVPYQQALEIARVPMTVGKVASSVEQLTISIDVAFAGNHPQRRRGCLPESASCPWITRGHDGTTSPWFRADSRATNS